MTAKTSWFEIKNEAAAPRAEILIDGEIGMFGITSQDFVNAFDAIPADRLIALKIHSPGGSVIEGMRMHNAIARRRKNVVAYIDVEAASMATVIACGASKIVMPSNGWFMIHNVSVGNVGGESDDLRSVAEFMDRLNAQIVDIYATKTGQTPEAIQEKMDATTWFNAKEAKAFGFCDEITDAIDLQGKVHFFDRFKNGPKSPVPAINPKAAETPPPTPPQNPPMKKLLEAMVAEGLLSSADLAEDAAVAEFGTNFGKIKQQLESAKTAEANALKAAAEAAIDAAIVDKRIVIDAADTEMKLRTTWVNNYLSNKEGTEAILASLKPAPAAAAAPEIPDPKTGRKPLALQQPKAAAPNEDATEDDLEELWKKHAALKTRAEKSKFYLENINPIIAKRRS